jgi:hypothetical protein
LPPTFFICNGIADLIWSPQQRPSVGNNISCPAPITPGDLAAGNQQFDLFQTVSAL